MKKGNRTKTFGIGFRRRMFDRLVQAIKEKHQDVPAAELEAAIDDAVLAVRKGRRRVRL